MNAQTMYTDAVPAATRRQSDAEITHVFKNKIKARCEHGNIINTLFTSIRNNRITSHRKITTYKLSPEMST